MIILTAAGSLDSLVQLITILFLFFFVLLITYVVTRWISGIQKGQMTGKNMELIETMRISNSQYFQIVRAGNKYLVVAVCKDTVTMLTELSADAASLNSDSGEKSLSFREILDKMKHQNGQESETDKENSNL